MENTKHITSCANPEIKKFAELKDKKGRETHGLFCVEGKRALETFLSAGWQCVQLIFTQDAYENFDLALRKNAPIMLVTESVVKKISTAVSPSGFMGIFELPEKSPLCDLQSGLVLYEIGDPGNMGTLIRSSVAFGAVCVVIGGCDVWSPKVIQASAGIIAYAHIIETNWQDLMSAKRNLRTYALVASAGKKLEGVDLRDGLLVVGNEAHGIPESVARQCDDCVAIAMSGPAESLNAAVAGSIALYARHARKS